MIGPNTSDGPPNGATFGAWPGFELPTIEGVREDLSVGHLAEDVLDATYYDASDLRLVRDGVSLCRVTSGVGVAWTVELPEAGGSGHAAAPRRVDVEAPVDSPPAAAVSLVRSRLRGAAPEPVARLQTRRRRLPLLVAGRVAGEVDDDEVSVFDGDRVAARFREVDVHVAADAPDGLLDSVADRLRAAGVGAPDPTPRLVRALGPRALQPGDLHVAPADSRSTVEELVRATIAASVSRIVEHDPAIRLDENVEGVHQARVGTRRLRSDLATLGPRLASDWADGLRVELKWLAGELGRVRDADVLLDRLDADTARLSREVDREAARRLLAGLETERSAGLDQLLGVLDSARYREVLDRLVDASLAPQLRGEGSDAAVDVLPKLARKPFRRLRRAVDDLGREPTDDDLHLVRIRSKQARYAAEVAVPVIGGPAKRLAKALRDMQDVLGDHQDAAVAEVWLRQAAGDAPADQAMAAGLLISAQRSEAAARQGRWRKGWKRASATRSSGWLA